MTFRPDRLKGLREAKGWTQPELAKLAGLSQSAITKAEKGKSGLSGEVVAKLATALDCTMDYLFGFGEKFPAYEEAAVRMAFAAFSRDVTVSDQQRDRCARILDHRDAPRTAAAWRSLAEMIELSNSSGVKGAERKARLLRP